MITKICITGKNLDFLWRYVYNYVIRKRRIEKNLTREQVAEQSGVAVSNIVRFEQKGLISLKNLIGVAMALGYTSEIKSLFAQPKYATMEELTFHFSQTSATTWRSLRVLLQKNSILYGRQ